MRLLNIQTWEFKEFYKDSPPYFITSHRWGDEELTFQEVSERRWDKTRFGAKKLLEFCKVARDLNSSLTSVWAKDVRWIWIDTCCIDKTNSVELQEALNSMFRWYAEADACLAFLHDVGPIQRPPKELANSFSASVWFERGWTLQELLAPKLVILYNGSWHPIGYKATVQGEIPYGTYTIGGIYPSNRWLSNATGIPEDVLWDFRKAERLSTAEKRSWMNNRETTRVEDTVYCQLGIFGVFMPLIYGEGEHAMVRLEEAIEQKERRRIAAETQPQGT